MASATRLLTMDGFTSAGRDAAHDQRAVGTALNVSPAPHSRRRRRDSFNVVLQKAGALVAGTVTAANVETINIAAKDTTSRWSLAQHRLADAGRRGRHGITVTGNANLTLTSANAKVSTVDASAMTGGITYDRCRHRG